MKSFSLILLFSLFSVLSFSQTEQLDLFFNKTEVFMMMNVEGGKIDYKGIKENPTALEELIALQKTLKVKDIETENYQKAFLINAYNLSVIKGLVDNYPVNSPQDITGFFDRITYEVADFGSVTLNQIENTLIRKKYDDPRVHFVLVCGAISCPPIIDKAYLPATLESQLNEQTIIALNNPDFIQVKQEEVLVSEIFKWYAEDFKEKGKTLIDFLNKYRKAKIASDKKIGYYTYNWTINSQNPLTNTSTSVIMEFTPSKLMKKGQWDLKIFNNLYTENKSADDKRNVTKNRPRQTFFTSTLEVYTGVSNTGRVNVGVVMNYRSNIGNNASALDVFKFQTMEGISRAGLSNIGAAIKISPFKKRNNISIQSTFFVPIFEDRANSYYLDRRSYAWENRLFYDKSFNGDKFQLFAQLDVTYFFGEKPQNASADENAGERFSNNSIAFPASVFLSYFPSSKFTVYVNAQQYQLVPVVQNGFGQEFTVAGMGAKYQITPRLNLEVSSSAFLRGTSSGLGNTYNFGARYVY